MAVDPVAGIAWQLELDIVDAFTSAVADAAGQAPKMLRELARVLEQGITASERERAHRTLAEQAQKSVLRSYAQTGKHTAPYRRTARDPRNRRYAGGVLRDALAAPENIVATPTRLQFMDLDLLDSRARHWARLNAGAAPLGRGSRRSFEVRWGTLTLAALGLDMSPSAAFYIPRGYWFRGGEGGDQFHPMGEGPAGAAVALAGRVAGERTQRIVLQRRKVSRGIKARNFMDAGVATIARDWPKVYGRMYDDLFKKAVVSVRPTRMRTRPSTVRRY